MKEDELVTITTGVKLQGIMPEIDAELEGYRRAIENRVFMELQKGELTPDKALFYWMQVLAQKRLLQKLTSQISVGQYIGSKNKDALDKLD